MSFKVKLMCWAIDRAALHLDPWNVPWHSDFLHWARNIACREHLRYQLSKENQ